MKKQSIKLPKNRIVNLDDDEIVAPLTFVSAFFDAAWLPEHLDRLLKWRNNIAFDLPKRKKQVNFLYDFELTIKLIESAWLLRKVDVGKLDIGKENDEVVKYWLKTEKKELNNHYPGSLNFKEMVKPYKVLKSTFKNYDLSGYRMILDRWLHDAMSTNFLEESLSKQDVIVVYEQIVKLIEAMWLIINREKNKKNI